MKLPDLAASPSVHSDYAKAVAVRLLLAGQKARGEALLKGADHVLTLGRSWEDTRTLTKLTRVTRDFVDGTLDPIAQEARLTLASRSLTATNEKPYTVIFAEGIGYFTEATLEDEYQRYTELVSRLKNNLPAKDPVAKTAIPALETNIKHWERAIKDVAHAVTAESTARGELDQAIDALRVQLQKTYGNLFAELGRAGAERFFRDGAPRTKKPSTPTE